MPVTVEEAIENGKASINKPVQIIQLITLVLTVIIFYYLHFPGWAYILVIPAAIVVPWIYWSFKITRWRIWAFENVDDVHSLKKRAIKAKLIWPDGSVFEKTEIRTKTDKARLKAIQEKLEILDI